MTPGSKRDRAQFLRASAENKGTQLRDAIRELADQLDRQADEQERGNPADPSQQAVATSPTANVSS
jgi:hypothetical protein